MPYFKDGKRYDRITEIVSWGDCKRLAHNDKNLSPNRPKRNGLVALTGTLLHQAIEKNEYTLIRQQFTPASLDENERKILVRLKREDMKIKKTKPEMISTYFQMTMDVQEMYGHYLQFLYENPHRPLFIERKFYSNKFMMGGTVDLIMEKEMHGRIVTEQIHKHTIPKRYFQETGNPNDPKYKVVTLVDWKSSKRKLPTHIIQLSGYHFMLEVEGFFDEMRAMGYEINKETWSCLFGKYKPSKTLIKQTNGNPPKYQLFKYASDSTAFLERLDIRLEDLTELTLDQDGNNGLKSHCLFCSDILNCSQWHFDTYPSDPDEIIAVMPFSKKELSWLTLILNKHNVPKFAQDLPDKINSMMGTIAERHEFDDDEMIAQLYEDLLVFGKEVKISV